MKSRKHVICEQVTTAATAKHLEREEVEIKAATSLRMKNVCKCCHEFFKNCEKRRNIHSSAVLIIYLI